VAESVVGGPIADRLPANDHLHAAVLLTSGSHGVGGDRVLLAEAFGNHDFRRNRTELISRTVKAVNYQHRGETKIDLRGTDQMPNERGLAEIRSRQYILLSFYVRC
jgi:hypothetical protein